MRKCFLNNRVMDAQRKDPMYQTIIVDLANCGAIDKDVAEGLLSYHIPEHLQLPRGFENFIDDSASDRDEPVNPVRPTVTNPNEDEDEDDVE